MKKSKIPFFFTKQDKPWLNVINTLFCSQSGINARLAVSLMHRKPYSYSPMTTVILNLKYNLYYNKTEAKNNRKILET